MAPAVTRAIRMLSTLHGQSPTQKANVIASMTVFSKEHFPKFLGFVCFSGFVSGFFFQESLHYKKEEKEIQNVYAQRRFTVILKHHQLQGANNNSIRGNE